MRLKRTMTFKRYVPLFLSFVLHFFSGYGQDFEWANSLAGKGSSNPQNLTEGSSQCFGLVTDEDDFVYITGICNDSVDFDPGPDTAFFVAGHDDVFLAKYAPSGSLVWYKVLLSQATNYVNAIQLDQQGNIVIIGSIGGDVDFDPGPGTTLVNVPSGTANKMFIAKYSENGDFIWVHASGGQYATWGNDLEIDPDGAIFITGTFYETHNFDQDNSNFTLTSNGLALFFAKYSENGDFVWARHIPNCSNLGGATDIDLSSNGSIFISGYFGGNLDFDPGSGSFPLVSNTIDRYFAKYTSDGEFVWANAIDVNNGFVLSNSRSIRLSIDSQENVYVTGDFIQTVDFDPGPGVFQLSANTGYANYLCKYASDGSFLWAKMLSGSFCVAYDIALNCEEKIHLSGSFLQADFDPGPDIFFYQSTAPSAFMNFFAQYDPDGNFQWVRRIGNNGYGGSVIPAGIHLSKGYQYVFGAFKQTGDFNPDEEDEYVLTMSGLGTNAFFAKYAGNWANQSLDTAVCDQSIVLIPEPPAETYWWQDGSSGENYEATESGTYWVILHQQDCSRTDTFHVAISECGNSVLKMPNIFTPNDDHDNDSFLPLESYNIPGYELVILNRWGNTMFTTRTPNEGWNGQHNGQSCPEGIYFWVVHYTNHNKQRQQLHGSLELIR